MKTLKTALQKHYKNSLNGRKVTDEEAKAEYENLCRRVHEGSGLFDNDRWLMMALPKKWSDMIYENKPFPE